MQMHLSHKYRCLCVLKTFLRLFKNSWVYHYYFCISWVESCGADCMYFGTGSFLRNDGLIDGNVRRAELSVGNQTPAEWKIRFANTKNRPELNTAHIPTSLQHGCCIYPSYASAHCVFPSFLMESRRLHLKCLAFFVVFVMNSNI